MRANENSSFEAAFWELYLHEAYLRSGFSVTIHPPVTGNSNHPDFLIESNESRFYLEAVRVGQPSTSIGAEKRLAEIHTLLNNMDAARFTVGMTVFRIGSNPPPVRILRADLTRWLGGLDLDKLAAEYEQHGQLRDFQWDHQDWSLEFEAIPMPPEGGGIRRRFVSVHGGGEARAVDNTSGICRVLDFKSKKYGTLDAPLVIAVMSNTEFPTYDYQVEQALFGLSSGRPGDSKDLSQLHSEGHWLSRQGWRRAHVPQVIAVHNLKPWLVTKEQPRLWNTLQPDTVLPPQPSWLARVDLSGPHATVAPASPLANHFGLPADWMTELPEFR